MDGTEKEFLATVLNISHRGVCLSSPEPLDVGTHIELRLMLEQGHMVEIIGDVVWTSFNHRTLKHNMGLQLEESLQGDLERFEQFYHLRLLTEREQKPH